MRHEWVPEETPEALRPDDYCSIRGQPEVLYQVQRITFGGIWIYRCKQCGLRDGRFKAQFEVRPDVRLVRMVKVVRV